MFKSSGPNIVLSIPNIIPYYRNKELISTLGEPGYLSHLFGEWTFPKKMRKEQKILLRICLTRIKQIYK